MHIVWPTVVVNVNEFDNVYFKRNIQHLHRSVMYFEHILYHN